MSQALPPADIAGVYIPLEADPRTTEELFAALLVGGFDADGNYDSETARAALTALRLRGTVEVFNIAAAFCRSDDPKARHRSLDVLAQSGTRLSLGTRPSIEHPPWVGESVAIAIQCLRDCDSGVVSSAAFALAHLRTEPGIQALIGQRHHTDANVRHAVALGLGFSESAAAVEVLTQLMSDEDEDVRNWATFGLGNSTADSPEIREALRARLNDPFEDAREEAIWGLARRKDPSALHILVERLESESPSGGDEMTAMDVLGLFGEESVETLIHGLRNLLAVYYAL